MTTKQAIKILKSNNKWRRGGNGNPTEPKILEEAIDIAIHILEHVVKEDYFGDKFQVKCDRCGKLHGETSEYAGWNDDGYALECALNDDWIEHEGGHYCPDCCIYDDEGEIVIK